MTPTTPVPPPGSVTALLRLRHGIVKATSRFTPTRLATHIKVHSKHPLTLSSTSLSQTLITFSIGLLCLSFCLYVYIIWIYNSGVSPHT